MPKTGVYLNFFSFITKQRGISVSVQSFRPKLSDNFLEFSSELFRPKKAENLGKKFAKNSGSSPAS